MKVIHVVLSGGVGSRLWPLSRKERPKQYLPIINEQSLFQLCANRNRTVTDELIVVGNCDNYLLSRKDLEASGIDNYFEIIEAIPRNTAAAIAFAAFSVSPHDILFITPADHLISGQGEYELSVKEAIKLAEKGFLVTFGLKPTKPETGFGYIEYSENDVISFREKPDLETAAFFVESGKFLWNSGMFCFKASVYLEELKKFQPAVFEKAMNAWNERNGSYLPKIESAEIPSVSVDYAVMEHSDKIKVIPASFEWSDLGSFGALWEYYEQNSGNEHLFLNKNLLLKEGNKRIEVVGLEGIIVIETKDAIMILPKERTQDVKLVYERIERECPELL
ncbi:mannose-1-phosphate guanylyltransferase [Filimonas effusa]|uniref:Mannose-1-phosphate guanylyltransferase n=1 Tax=Filimonas effusa TaxID=2508721 RepID=A0A4Q1DD84_9BACT|nr:sugar phosphate nucleotidyltransferase [Filimonas effusa]RXK87360.1 mannose-1-phosphate guanylyltransferase [Filimonas effusa]